MKINKKVLIPVFATAMGLSVIGGISGAVAWYQYNSKVSASFVGTSVADTGVLQIGEYVDHDNNESTPKVLQWGRDITKGGSSAHLVPCTFGALDANGQFTRGAYAYPEAGAGEGYTGHEGTERDIDGWVAAEKGKHYAQFKVYLQAYQTNDDVEDGYELVERDVYLSDIILGTLTSGRDATDALRVHIDNGDKGILIANKEHAASSSELNLYGGLDLDKNGHNDKYHATPFNEMLGSYGNHPSDDREATHDYGEGAVAVAGKPYWDGEEIVYGVYGETQITNKASDMVVTRESDGTIAEDADLLIGTTSTDAEHPLELTITVWLEGWELLKPSSSGSAAVLWNPEYNAGCEVQVGLQFDTGKFRENDLPNPQPVNP